MIDLGAEAEARADRLLDAAAIDHRQHAGHRGVNQTDLGIGRGAETDGGAAEQFGVRGYLGVDLQPQHDFPGAGGAFDQIGLGFRHSLTYSRADRRWTNPRN